MEATEDRIANGDLNNNDCYTKDQNNINKGGTKKN